MRPIDTIIRDYEKYRFIAVTEGACPPPPTWEEVGALIEEVVSLRARLANKEGG